MEIDQLEYEDVQIEVPWGFIFGRWYGNRKVRPILALHGWQDNLGTWTPLIPLLPRHIGILCLDFPGHGHSSRYFNGVTYHMLDYVNTILSVKKAYQWKKISLMGHSMGSIVSYIYASLYPETIDLLIQIDIIKNPQRPHEFILGRFEGLGEKIPLEDDHYYAPKEPRLYTFDELVEIIHRGSAKSINKECCKYLIERGCKRSPKDPEKLYFARDPKTKYYLEYDTHHNYHLDFAKRIKNLNHLVIKGSRSKYIGEDSRELIQLIKNQNPNFEFYEVEGTHHVHLNNPVGVAEKIVPFICKYRPEGAEEQNELERVNAKCKL